MGKAGSTTVTAGACLTLLALGAVADCAGGWGLGTMLATLAVKGLAIGAGGAAGNAVWDLVGKGRSAVADRLRDPRKRLANHDLQALAGRAIAVVTAATAKDLQDNPAGTKYLARIAGRFPAEWTKAASGSKYEEILDKAIPRFFGRADGTAVAPHALTPKLWEQLLGTIAGTEVDADEQAALEVVAKRLHEQFPKALFELAKEDFAPEATDSPHDGKAFAAVLLSLIRDTMGGVGELLQGQRQGLDNDKEILKELKDLNTQLAARANEVARLAPEDVAAIVTPIKDEVNALSRSLTASIDNLAEQSKVAAAAAVDNRDLLKAHGFTPLIASNLPPLPVGYVERPAPMAALEKALGHDGRANVMGRAQAAAGGGYGKSVLAVAYAHKHRQRYSGGVYIVSCEGRSVVAALTPLLPDHEGVRQLPAEVKAAIVRAKLSAGGPALLILDNIDSADQWHEYRSGGLLPSSPCDVLITTRADDIKDVSTVAVDQLEEHEAIEILGNYRASAKLPANAQAIALILRETERIAALVAAVGMAIAEDQSDDWAKYAAWLASAQPDALPDAGDWIKHYRDYPHKTAAILDDLRRRLHPASVRALDYAALLPADMIPRGWLEWLLESDFSQAAGERQLTPENDTTGNPRAAVWYVNRLKQLGVLRRFGEDDTLWSLHRLHRKRAMDHFAAELERESAAWVAIGKCAAARRVAVVGVDEPGKLDAVNDPLCLTTPALRWELSPLLSTTIALARAGQLKEAGGVAGWLANPLGMLGRLAEARTVLDSLLEDESALLAVLDETDFALLLNDLATIQQDQGELSGARTSLERAIIIQEKLLPADHLTFATSYSNLALIRKAQGDLPGARVSMERAIAIGEKHVGSEHPILATMRSNLATIQRDQGDLSGARESMERAIAIEERHFAPDHPTFAISYSNLSVIQRDQGDLPGARASMERAIAINEKTLDDNHPIRASDYNNLAQIQQDQGDLSGAWESMEKTIAIEEKLFAADHPTLAISYSNLAAIQRKQGNLEGSRASMERAIAINERNLDENHHVRGRDYSNLARIAVAQGNMPEAVALLRRAYGILFKSLGPDHSYTKSVGALLCEYDPPRP